MSNLSNVRVSFLRESLASVFIKIRNFNKNPTVNMVQSESAQEFRNLGIFFLKKISILMSNVFRFSLLSNYKISIAHTFLFKEDVSGGFYWTLDFFEGKAPSSYTYFLFDLSTLIRTNDPGNPKGTLK